MSQDIVERYRNLHWGAEAKKVIRVDDDLMPDCAQMGPLTELYVVMPGDAAVQLAFPAGSHVAIDPAHPVDRIHLVTPPAYRAETRRLFAVAAKGGAQLETLNSLAAVAGGRQAEHDYPDLAAVDLGVVTAIVYGPTLKTGDGLSEYIHHFGVEGDEAHVVNGVQPRLAADEEGRLWLVGGDYTVPDEGITG